MEPTSFEGVGASGLYVLWLPGVDCVVDWLYAKADSLGPATAKPTVRATSDAMIALLIEVRIFLLQI